MPGIQADGEHDRQYESGGDRRHTKLGGGSWIQGYNRGVTANSAVLRHGNCDTKYFIKMNKTNIKLLKKVKP